MKGQGLINVWNESSSLMLILLTCPVALLIVHVFSPLYLSIVAVFVAFNLCIQCILSSMQLYLYVHVHVYISYDSG